MSQGIMQVIQYKDFRKESQRHQNQNEMKQISAQKRQGTLAFQGLSPTEPMNYSTQEHHPDRAKHRIVPGPIFQDSRQHWLPHMQGRQTSLPKAHLRFPLNWREAQKDQRRSNMDAHPVDYLKR